MQWERFVKKEEKPKEYWEYEEDIKKREKKEEIYKREEIEYFRIKEKEVALPITGVCNISQKIYGAEEHLINNEQVGLIVNEHMEIVRFFKLPSVLPRNLVYFSENLFIGISRAGDEVISFTLGGPGSDSPFSIGNYSVCAHLKGCIGVYAEEENVYVLYEEGVCVLRPVACK
ncbi:hypothetical protein NEFER03_1386 [Nematocida sp. LUAm3]|nr:hypothetical protein NEFER03_1386 [Nematocida sp. LUAm3]KAI5174784.1 hypothetical protein NEFER02_0894 [Nematocida sp. LUAm2]KAI5177805.1 hypothetical protein NEFER01_1007 [Nematocida sp. LUAm1]